MKESNRIPYRLEQINFHKIKSPLLAFQKKIASQTGEDGIIERIFKIVKTTNKYCVEFGAWDGKYLSNCWNLVSNKGWRGCFIEGNKDKFKDLLNSHSHNKNVACVNRFVGLQGANSLDNILREVGAPKNLDFLSIDVDGTDYFIWESVRKFKPRVVVIEFNPTVPNDVIFVQAKTNDINQGCSLLALIQLGKKKGYELVCCIGCNAFFVKRNFLRMFRIPNNFISNMYKPGCDGRIFQGYDSQIYVTGMTRLVWSGIEVDSSDFQVVPSSMRRFGDSQKH